MAATVSAVVGSAAFVGGLRVGKEKAVSTTLSTGQFDKPGKTGGNGIAISVRALSTSEFGKSGKTISPWQDVPLKAGDGMYNFIVEILKESSAKFDVAADSPNTPIKQDTKKGKLQFNPYNTNWNYGLLPQTWENPSHANPDGEGAFGDNDPGCSEGEEEPVHSGDAQKLPLRLSSIKRRAVMGRALSLLISAVSLPALAAESDTEFSVYEDKKEKYSLLVPPAWTKGEGTAGLRKVTAFYPEEDSSTNVNVVITDIGADYTALGSFGTIDIFAENLVNSLDRAWQRPKGQAAKLIDSRAKNGMYYVEYTVQQPGKEKRHLLSVVGMASNGWVNRLFTVTGQFWENDGVKYKATLEKAISSFRLT